MKSQDGQAQLRRTALRWIKAYALFEPLQQLRGHMEAPSFVHPEAIAAAMGVLNRHLAALNSGDAVALAQTLHFPHYRLAGGRMNGSAQKPIYRTFTPAWGMNGATALGIFVSRSVPVQTKYTSTCSSAGTALTDQYWVGIALYGSLVRSTNAGLRSCGRALPPRCRCRQRMTGRKFAPD